MPRDELNQLADDVTVLIGMTDALRATLLAAAVDEEERRLEDLRADRALLTALRATSSPRVLDVDAAIAASGERRAAFAGEAARAVVPAPDPENGAEVVHGRVADDQGRGLANMSVRARDGGGRVVSRTTTDDQGTYVLAIPAAGEGKQTEVTIEAAKSQRATPKHTRTLKLRGEAVQWCELTVSQEE